MIVDPNTSSDLEFVSVDPLSAELPADRWRELGVAAPDPNPFFGPDFLLPYLRCMAVRGVRLAVVRERATGRWLLAAPVGLRRAGLVLPVRTAWATDYSPLGTPLVHPEADTAAVRVFAEGAAGPGGLVAIPFLPLASRAARLFQEALPGHVHILARSERACHDAGAAGEAQLGAAFSGKRRKEMKRQLRRLADLGPVRFESLTGAAAVAGFEAFLTLEASGWKGRGGTSLNSRPETAAFSRTAFARSAEAGNLRLDQLWVGEHLAAALVCFLQSGWVYTWKIAFDEEFSRYSPGAQIAVQAFRDNLALPGFRGADSLAIPGHSMIEPLWPGRLETGTMLIALGGFARLKQDLATADLALEQYLRGFARRVKQRLRK